MTTIRWSGDDDFYSVETDEGDLVRVRRASRNEMLDGDAIKEEVRKALASEPTTREVVVDQRARR